MDGVDGAADSETGREDDRAGAGSPGDSGSGGKLLAVSDLHVSYAENRSVVQALRPHSEEDWLLVAGDISERLADIAIVLRLL
ncbi:metallophosphoesterase, partial [Actinocrinis sp.]|uniref:metallophosphoesterase n=1 Tax=Actinocrinis sp. TaxID=1920516 RepID=UPI002D420CC7